MDSDTAFAEVMAGLQAGDDDAATAVYDRFAHRLMALAHLHLAPLVRLQVDPEDVVQSVFRSFFRRQAAGPETFAHWRDLWRRLAVIAVRKCARKSRRALRDLQAVRPLDPMHLVQMLDRQPRPEEAVALTDLLASLMRRLRPSDREFLVLLLQGYGTGEISEQIGCSERRVQRALVRIRARLDHLLG